MNRGINALSHNDQLDFTYKTGLVITRIPDHFCIGVNGFSNG